MRSALLAIGALALLVLLLRRRAEPRDPAWDEDEDGVQGPDPHALSLTLHMDLAECSEALCDNWTTHGLCAEHRPDDLEALTDADRDWLATAVRTKPLGGM